MNGDSQERENYVPLGKARKRDIARRALVGLHKNKQMTEAGSIVNEQISELKAFEHNLQVQYMTNEGSKYVAKCQRDFLRSCMNPDSILPFNHPTLPQLPPGFTWNIYKISNFMEAGRITQLRIRATYNLGKGILSMHFMLTKKHPNDPNFTQEDILYHNPLLNLVPLITGPGFGNWATWFDKKMDIFFNYAFASSQQTSVMYQPTQGGRIDTELFIVCEEWRGLAPTTQEMRVDIMVEDRGR